VGIIVGTFGKYSLSGTNILWNAENFAESKSQVRSIFNYAKILCFTSFIGIAKSIFLRSRKRFRHLCTLCLNMGYLQTSN
jgi:hypothetical protein